jgi:putative flippase GtrA
VSDELSTAAPLPRRVSLPFHVRVRRGVRRPHNWLQLGRFTAVGASGYVVNLAVFAVCVHLLAIDYRVSSVLAFVISVANNFLWNRHWTFGARQAHPIRQGAKFFAVSLIAFGFTYAVLVALVSGLGVTKVFAQAIAVAAGTPLNFLGQKLWSFKA